jgi:O-antigen ligase
LRYLSIALTAVVAFSMAGRVIALAMRNIVVLLFLGWSLVSVFWSTNVGSTLSTFVGLFGIVILATVLTLLGRQVDIVAVIMWVFTSTSALSVAVAILLPKVGTVVVIHPTEGRLVQPIGVFGWNSDLGFSAAVAAAIATALMLRRRTWWLGALVVFNSAVVVFSNSAATLVVLAVGLTVVVLMQGRWIAISVCGVAIVGAVIGVATLGGQGFIDVIFSLLKRSSTLTGRVNLWQATLEQWTQHPVLGAGAGVEPNLKALTTAIHSHNGYIQVLFDRGVVGLIIFLMIIAMVAIRVLRARDAALAGALALVLTANLANDYFTYASLGFLLVLTCSYGMVRGEPRRRAGDPVPTTRNRVWVSAEIREEIEEILHMLGRGDERWKQIRIDAPAAVLGRMTLPAAVRGAVVVAEPFEHRVGINVAGKLVGLLSFWGRLVLHRPDLLVSGFSMMKHRAVSGLLGIPHVAYIRGVAFDPSVSVGISDKLRFGAFRKLIPSRVVATYSADAVVTVGEVNRQFLVGRGIPDEAVHVSGPVWLEGAQHDTSSRERSPRAYFITGAWEAHGMLEEHEAQLALTRRLASEWHGTQRFALRVHPRDHHDYETDPAFAGTDIDRTLPSDFLAGLRDDDVLIAPLSTLAFEAIFLGHGVVFYSDEKATKAYFHVYEKLGIKPATADDLVAGDYAVTQSLAVEVLSRIDETAFPAAVMGAERAVVKAG